MNLLDHWLNPIDVLVDLMKANLDVDAHMYHHFGRS